MSTRPAIIIPAALKPLTAQKRWVVWKWVSFPTKPYETKNGDTAWQPNTEFAEGAKQAREQFREQALEAIHAVAGEAVS
jgi:hypothetical protein